MTSRERLQAAGRLAENALLGPLTTYGFGGPARFLVTVDGEQDLRDAWEIAAAAGLPVVALGRGSNIVVADDGFEGVIVHAGPGLSRRSVGEDVVAGAGTPLPLLARESSRAGRGGLEFFTGIPGSVGGAVRMNAGCHGAETSEVLISARVFDGLSGAIADHSPSDLGLGYRHSNLDDTSFVIEARFATVPRTRTESEDLIRKITRWRRDNHPGGTLNAGSVFKNPEGDTAGRIVDSLDLKGFSSGAVSVSERHANFFVAGPGASAGDVHSLVMEVKRRVFAATGIDLEPEIRFVGDFG